jgi:hypothetical protein
MIYSTLLFIHITAGSASLLGAAGAIATKVFDTKHKWHILAGRVFFVGMVLVFLTTLPMTLLKPNLFLFLIGIFSFYLAFTGWRKAVNRSGKAGLPDKLAAILMSITSIAMLGWGGWLSFVGLGDGNGITLIAFGAIGGLLARKDIRQNRGKSLKGIARIRAHLISMMAATIAATTAFLVVNLETDPILISWLLPSAIISPIIVWMSRKMLPSRS